MNNILNFLKTRTLSYWLSFITFVFSILFLIIYINFGRTQFDPDYSVLTIVGISLTIVTCLVSIVLSYKAFFYTQYVLWLFVFLSFVTSQLNLIGNIFYNVDGSTAPFSFFFLTFSSFSSIILNLVAAIIYKRKKQPNNQEVK